MSYRISRLCAGMFALIWGIAAFPLHTSAADGPAAQPATATASEQAQSICDKALNYLKSQQKPDFTWQNASDPPGLSALVLRAFVADAKYHPDDPFIHQSFTKLLSYQLENGGIYKDTLAAYNTAIAISALATSRDTGYRGAVDRAVAYLKTLQWTDKIQGVPEDQRPKSDKDVRYGGYGYGGGNGRPDLSNTQMALDALHEAGLKPEDPAFQAALKFATRSQNLSETNDQPWAGDDGGFVYTPGNNGSSPAGEIQLAGKRMLRSYGSMTYAGLKSMIYAGLSHDDPRVKAAWDWIGRNYTVDENPGMAASGPENAQGGLYYYYYTMARALSVYGQPTIVDAQGKKHDWRVDLIGKVATLQKADGSFVGMKKWMEDNPVLTTAYTVIAVEIAKQDLKDHPVGSSAN